MPIIRKLRKDYRIVGNLNPSDGDTLVWDGELGAWVLLGGGICKIKTGTYVGDGTENHAITGVGFLPKFLWISMHPTAEGEIYTVTKMDQSWGVYAIMEWDGRGPWSFNNRIISIDSDGFTVSDYGIDTHPNKNGQVYDYLALG